MIKLECNPSLINSRVEEILVTIEITKSEKSNLKLLNKNEYEKFIREKATVTITDASIDWEVPPIEDWDDSE